MNLSQKELAFRVDVNQTTISNFESGRAGLSSKTLDKIIDVLGI